MTGSKRSNTEKFDVSAALEEIGNEQFNFEEILQTAPKEGDEDYGYPDVTAIINSDPEEEKPKEEEVPAPTPEPEPKKEADDQRILGAQMQAQFELYRDAAERKIQELTRGLQPSKEPEPEPQFQDPLDTIRQLQQQVALLNEHNEVRHQADTRSRFRSAVEEVKSQYPDLLDRLPMSALENGLKFALESREYGADFKTQIEMAYKLQSFNDYHRQVQELSARKEQEADELARKRETKKQAASVVAGGGGTYQQPEFSKPNDRTMRGGKSDFLAEYLASGG